MHPTPHAIVDDQHLIAQAITAAGLAEAAHAAAQPGQNASMLVHTTPGRARLFAWCGGDVDEEPAWLMIDGTVAELISLISRWHAAAGKPSRLN